MTHYSFGTDGSYSSEMIHHDKEEGLQIGRGFMSDGTHCITVTITKLDVYFTFYGDYEKINDVVKVVDLEMWDALPALCIESLTSTQILIWIQRSFEQGERLGRIRKLQEIQDVLEIKGIGC